MGWWVTGAEAGQTWVGKDPYDKGVRIAALGKLEFQTGVSG